MTRWIVSLVVSVPLVVAAGFMALRPTQSIPAGWLSLNSTTEIALSPGKTGESYRFSANPGTSTPLQLHTTTANFHFSAEVKDDAGQIIALLRGDRLRGADLMLEASDQTYEITLMANSTLPGTVALTLGELPPPPTPTPQPTAVMCAAVGVSGLETGIYSLPRTDQTIVAMLPASEYMVAKGRIRGGWLLVESMSGLTGWIPGEGVRLYGPCDSLPTVLDPAIPAAPADAESFALVVDRDGAGEISQEIAYPYHDISDLIWVNVINLYHSAPANYREFTISVSCEGVGTESILWGAPSNPTLRCGEQITLPFQYGVNQLPFVVMLPQGIEQSYVRYTLRAVSSHAG